MQLVNVEDAILNATKLAVPKEVVLFVRVQWTRDNSTQGRLPMTRGQKSDNLIASFLPQIRTMSGSH